MDLFQVVTGGHLDIDVKLYSPDLNVIFEVSKLTVSFSTFLTFDSLVDPNSVIRVK